MFGWTGLSRISYTSIKGGGQAHHHHKSIRILPSSYCQILHIQFEKKTKAANFRMKSIVILALFGCLCALVINVSSRSVSPHRKEIAVLARSDSDSGTGGTVAEAAAASSSDSSNESSENDSGGEDSNDTSMEIVDAGGDGSDDVSSLEDRTTAVEPTTVAPITVSDKD